MRSIMKKSCIIILMLTMLATSIGGFSSVMLAKASDTSDVTMEDGVKYVKYEDISGYRTTKNENGYYIRSPKQSGYIFGGWFAEAGENSTAVTATSGAAWAKFVPEETFTIKGQISIAAPTSGVGFSDLLTSVEKVNLRLVTGVDSLKYQKVIFKMNDIVKYWLDNNMDIAEETEKFIEYAKNKIIVMDNVGSGIVPVDKSERRYREAVGCCGAIIAKNCTEIYNVLYGIGLKIKG